MQRVFDFLRTDDLPPLSRVNYVAETRQMFLWGVVVGAVEGSMASVVASKTFGAGPLLTQMIWSLPILVNVLNVFWSNFMRGRRRKPLFAALVSFGLLGVASIGLNDADWRPWGAWLFTAQIAFSHLFLSALITLRTTMWKANYPDSVRARIAGRLQTLRILLSAITSGLLGLLFNEDPGWYRVVYPAAACVGLLSLVPFRRIRMRGERQEIKRFRAHVVQKKNNHSDGRISAREGVAEAFEILRTDRLFARYMLAQFLLGAANFFTDPLLVNVLTKKLDFDYFSSQGVLYLIPMTALLVSIRYWAPFFDRVGVLRFRIYNSGCWLASYIGITIAMGLIALGGELGMVLGIGVMIASRVMTGLGRGGGAIAWTLGHLHFAREHQTELYMGIHVGLTGLRGLVMPLIAWAISAQLGKFGLDWCAFVVAVGLAGASHVMFRKMAAEDHSPRHPDEACAEAMDRSTTRSDVS